MENDVVKELFSKDVRGENNSNSMYNRRKKEAREILKIASELSKEENISLESTIEAVKTAVLIEIASKA